MWHTNLDMGSGRRWWFVCKGLQLTKLVLISISRKTKSRTMKAAGMTKDVTFEMVQGNINDLINEAYKEQYSKSQYMPLMIESRAKAATVRIVPK